MATGFGIGPDQNGNGTTPADIQRITSAEYIWEGIINRCGVSGTTEMKYKIEGGAAVIKVGDTAKVKVPVYEQTIPTDPAPATGTRYDKIYVKQNFPATDGDNQVVCGVTSGALPPNSLQLAEFIVHAGDTSTKQATNNSVPVFTRPVGASFGTLYEYTDTDTSQHDAKITRGAGSFNLWTDSDVELKLSSCISNPDSAVGWEGSVLYSIYVDGNIEGSWERRWDNVWEVKEFTKNTVLQAGVHTVKYTVEPRWANAGHTCKWRVRYGGPEQFPGDYFSVIHRGVSTGYFVGL